MVADMRSSTAFRRPQEESWAPVFAGWTHRAPANAAEGGLNEPPHARPTQPTPVSIPPRAPRLHFAAMLAAQEAPHHIRSGYRVRKPDPQPSDHSQELALPPKLDSKFDSTLPPDECIYSPKPCRRPAPLLQLKELENLSAYRDRENEHNPVATRPNKHILNNFLRQLDASGLEKRQIRSCKAQLRRFESLHQYDEKELRAQDGDITTGWVDDMPRGDGNGGRGRASPHYHREEARLNASSRHFYLTHAR